MNTNEENNEDRALGKLQERRKSIQAMTERLTNGGEPKQFNGESRLKAAFLILQLYRKALKERGLKSSEINSRCHAAVKNTGDFRIHRWMLPASTDKIADGMVGAYRDKPEPLKKVRTYIALVKAFSEILDLERDELLGEFYDETGLLESTSSVQQDEEQEFKPERRLAYLLNEFAAITSTNLDLPKLFKRSERAHVGWNPVLGPGTIQPLGRDFADEGFEASRNVMEYQWGETELPPYPCAKIARIPYGHIDNVEFMVEAKGDTCGRGEMENEPVNWQDDGNFLIFRGSATAYWDLYITIAPKGLTGVGAFFLRVTSVDVALFDREKQATSYTVGNYREDFNCLDFQYNSPATIDFDGSRRISFTENTSKELLQNDNYYEHYFRVARCEDELDELPPSFDLPATRITRVTAQGVMDWLIEDLSLNSSETEVGVIHEHPFNDSLYKSVTRFQDESLARDVEVALHDGTLTRIIAEWATQYSTSLDEFEERTADELFNAEEDLLKNLRDMGERKGKKAGSEKTKKGEKDD